MELIAEGFTAEIYRWGAGQALKLYRSLFAPVAEREFEVMQSLAGCGLSIPRAIQLLEVDGRPGYVMEEVAGACFRDLLESDENAAPQLAAALGKLHASIHACPASGIQLESILDRVAGKIKRADTLGDLTDPVRATIDGVHEGATLCHNDFHFGNVLQDDGGTWIIDWNGAGLGDPHSDLGKSTVLMEHGPEGICFGPRAHKRRTDLTATYLEAYAAERELDDDLLEKWQILRAAELISLGVPFSNDLKILIEDLL